MIQIDELVRQAIAAREKAYAPYSGFWVGAALLSSDGRVYTGCNIENAAFSPSNCAERTAIFKAVSEGVRTFEMIAVAGAPANNVAYKDITVPCGVCLQVMLEFCNAEEFSVIAANQRGGYRKYLLSQLLPHGFRL